MLITIIKKEFINLWREGRVKWFATVIALLLLITLVTSYRYSEQLRKEHDAAMRADREVWDNQSEKNPHGAAHFGFYLFKPVHPLSIVEPGIDRYTGATLFLEAHKRNSEQFSNITDQGDLVRFGYFSPAFVLQFLIPLLIIVAGFNIITRERESGNLPLLLSQGCTSQQLFLGKWLSLLLLVGLVLVPVFAAGMILLLLRGADAYSYGATTGMLLLYLLYYSLVINTVLLIGSKANRSGPAFLYCIIFWIVCSVITPRVVSNLSQQVSPLLTNDEIVEKVNALNKSQHRDVHALGGEAYKKLVDSMLKQYKVDTITQLPVNMAGVRLDVGEQMDTRNYEQVLALQREQLQKQQRIITAGSLFSPLIPTQQLSMALANTDIYSHQHFTDSAEAYRRTFVNLLNKYIAYESGLQEGYTAFKAGPDLWKRVPAFHYSRPGFSVLSHYLVPAVVLLLWLLISGWALKKSSNHFKPV
jgi:ABC-2 type transport system permease protein